MAEQPHFDILAQGVPYWNSWRKQNFDIEPDLRKANLTGADLREADLRKANLHAADLREADLREADLSGANLFGADLHAANLHAANLDAASLYKADLSGANLSEADLSGAGLSEADLTGANLSEAQLEEADLVWAKLFEANLMEAQLERAFLSNANLREAKLFGADLSGANLFGADLSRAFVFRAYLPRADLSRADLSGAKLHGSDLSQANLSNANLSRADLYGADLTQSSLVNTTLERAILTGCKVYGISAWDLNLTGAEQKDLVISPRGAPAITSDDLEVAQFIYLLLKNEKIRNVIDAMTSKAVLILGNFSEERMAVLEEIRNQLRERNYLPILFDFKGPESQDLIETVTTIARLARFVIADITQPRAVPDELRAIVTGVSVPIQPFIMATERPYATFHTLRSGRTSILKLRRYEDTKHLVSSFEEEIVGPANAKFRELEMERISALAEEA